MNITKKDTGHQTALITVNITPEDYTERYLKTLKGYARTASIPGFRKGMVPMGQIKKMYGKGVLADELNKILSDTIYKYIKDEKIDVLGSPLPQDKEQQNFEEGNSFEFLYELGIAPSFDVNIDKKNKIPYFLVKIDDKMVEDDMNDLRRRYGKFSNPETSVESNILYGDFAELNADGSVKEDGNKTTTSLTIELMKDETERKKFVGVKKDDVINFHPMTAFGSDIEVSAMLKLKREDEALNSNYSFTVKTINQVDKAEMNQEFFDKIYGEGNVKSEDEFKAKIREGIASYFENNSDSLLRKAVKKSLLASNSIPLPDDFLKRMIKASSKKESELHDLDHQYLHQAEDLRWRLIVEKVAASNTIQVNQEDIENSAASMIRSQYMQYGMHDIEAEKLKEIVTNYLNENDNYERVGNAILEQRVFEILKKEVSLDIHELPYNDFVAKLNEKEEHHH